jgi:hypothetical protein
MARRIDREELKVKKTLVLTTVVLATLASRVVLAASEGGDTWSALAPVQQSVYSAAGNSPRVDSSEPALHAAFNGSEGGDTWSSVQTLRDSGVQEAGIQERPASIAARYAGPVNGSEGGDTWSRFLPQFQSQPTGSAGLAPAPQGSNDYWQPPFGG